MKTYLKARCRKTGKWFGLEVEKNGASPAVITNFVDITEDMANHITPQYSVDENIQTGKNLIACKYCRSRKFAGCSCNKNRKSCRPTDKYDFQCVYCNELEMDYSGATGDASDVYNHVSVSNLPRSAFDRHGNPQGDQFDLAKDGSMKGFRVVIIKCCTETGWDLSFPKRCLERKGFSVVTFENNRLPSDQDLQSLLSDKKTQIWILSSYEDRLSRNAIDIIINAYKQGRGVYMMGDNEPFFKEANHVLERLYGVSMYGDLPGDKVITIQRANGEPGIIPNHPIGTGIINFYEGVTIATIPCKGTLRPLVYGSAKNVVTAYDDSNQCRLLADGGFTRLYYATDKAGTERFIVNCAIWLANIERVGHRNLPKL